MDGSFISQNSAERERLKALVARLGEDDLRMPIGHGWTAAVALAHLAYWDRRTMELLEKWDGGVVRVEPSNADAINDGLLPQWLAMPPREAAQQAVDAAEAVDRRAETVSAETVQAVMALRPRALIRALHRREHLDEIEQALAGPVER